MAVLSERQKADNIFFLRGGAVLDATSRGQLQDLMKSLESVGADRVCLSLVGHADKDGGKLANLRLSVARASAVAEFLASRGAQVTEIKGVGSRFPLPNFDPVAPENRRVELMARQCS